MALVTRHWSGKQRAVVQGINLVSLLWTDGEAAWPCDVRIYGKATDHVTKNDHFRAMLDKAKARGLAPDLVAFDSWYASLANLKQVCDLGWHWLTQLKSDRLVDPDRSGNRPIRGFSLVIQAVACMWQKQERHPLKQKRLHALYLLASGQATERQQVASLLGVSRNSVGHWLDAYADGGLKTMLTVKPPPRRVPALNEAQLTQVQEALARPEGFGSYDEVQQWIAAELGVTMKYHAVYDLVHDKLDAHPKVPRPTHPQKVTRP